MIQPQDKCNSYNLCGAYGNCIIGESGMRTHYGIELRG